MLIFGQQGKRQLRRLGSTTRARRDRLDGGEHSRQTDRDRSRENGEQD